MSEKQTQEIQKMEEEALNCDKVCNFGGEPAPAPEPKTKKFVIKKK